MSAPSLVLAESKSALCMAEFPPAVRKRLASRRVRRVRRSRLRSASDPILPIVQAANPMVGNTKKVPSAMASLMRYDETCSAPFRPWGISRRPTTTSPTTQRLEISRTSSRTMREPRTISCPRPRSDTSTCRLRWPAGLSTARVPCTCRPRLVQEILSASGTRAMGSETESSNGGLAAPPGPR